MSLHRTGKFPDWEKVPRSQQNRWQRIAAKTHGIVTPGNAVSLTGALLVGAGLRDINRGRKTRGTILVGAGRMLDLGDGFTADATGTKSPTGEGVDAVIDKAEALGLFVLARKGIVPMDRAIAIGTQNVANIALSVVGKTRGVEMHPSRGGKDGVMGQWLAIGSHCVEEAARDANAETLATVAGVVADVCYHASSGLGVRATEQYAKDAFATV